MKKLTGLILLILIVHTYSFSQEKHKLGKNTVDFFSEAPIENISATNNQTIGIIDFSQKTFLIKIPIKRFIFEKNLMQEHFNENYMESDKFPYGVFKGKVIGDINLKEKGNYTLSFEGKLTVHGIEKERKVPVTISVKKKSIDINSTFNILIKDHNIKIPKIVFKNIAEEIEVKINANLISL